MSRDPLAALAAALLDVTKVRELPGGVVVELSLDTAAAIVAEVRAARDLRAAAPSIEHLHDLVRWCDLLDKFASMVDETYTLPRDEIQRDLRRLADALVAYDRATQARRDGAAAGTGDGGA